MPKLRDPIDSLRDMQRHLAVFQSRSLKHNNDRNNHEVLALTSEVSIILNKIISKLPQEPKSFSAKLISSELNLINKEVKKNVPRIDYHSAVPAMCNSTDMKQVYIIGKQYNMPPEEIDQVIREADPQTNLGKAYAALKAKQTKQTPVGAAVDEEEEDTIDSDETALDEQIKRSMGGK